MRYTGLDLRRSFSSISVLDTVLPPFRLMCLLCDVRLIFCLFILAPFSVAAPGWNLLDS